MPMRRWKGVAIPFYFLEDSAEAFSNMESMHAWLKPPMSPPQPVLIS